MTRAKTTQELMADGQGLVHSLASRVYRSVPVRVDLDDLIAYGEVGLAEAARDYKPDHGAAFTTFAYHRVRGAIYDGLSKMSWTSRARYRRLRYEQMANEVLAQEEPRRGGKATLEGEATWFRNVTAQLGVVYLASQADDAGDSLRDSNWEDPRAVSGPAVVAQREVSQKLLELVDKLPGQNRRLIRAIYFQGFTLQEAADRLGIHKSWASRLHSRTLAQLARSLRNLGVSD
jgi:RNA polymerase sigma factor for flagellar operon FliA